MYDDDGEYYEEESAMCDFCEEFWHEDCMAVLGCGCYVCPDCDSNYEVDQDNCPCSELDDE